MICGLSPPIIKLGDLNDNQHDSWGMDVHQGKYSLASTTVPSKVRPKQIRANCYCLKQFQTKLRINLGDAVRSHVNGAGDGGNDNRTLQAQERSAIQEKAGSLRGREEGCHRSSVKFSDAGCRCC